MERFDVKPSSKTNEKEDEDKRSYVNVILDEIDLDKKAKKYHDVSYIPPTSDVVERLFSKCKLILTDNRKAMTPYTFECVVFLGVNRVLWDKIEIQKLFISHSTK